MTTQISPSASFHCRLQPVGNTPLLHLASLSHGNVNVYAKAEWKQPGGSVKARAAHAIISYAISLGRLFPGKKLLDASSGNTAIAYATLLQHTGIGVTICLPSNASSDRKRILRDLGAELILTSPLEGTDGAREKAIALASSDPLSFYYADQYSNDQNWKAHYHTTAEEIWNQTNGTITHFIAGLGTTGTFTGTSRRLKEMSDIMCISLQPDQPLHPLEGWKHLASAHTPAIYDPAIADQTKLVGTNDTYDMIRFIAEHEGLYLSPSSAANLQGAADLASSLTFGVIVTTLADTLDRYTDLSHELFDL